MKISTKGRYALRVMVDLAEHEDGNYHAMKDVASRQDVSLKYLEKILPSLVKSGLVEGTHGKGGGYRLTKEPEQYSVGEILRATEGDLAPVACLECGTGECGLQDDCRTKPMWVEVNSIINNYFDSVSISDLMKKDDIRSGLMDDEE